MRNHVLQQRHLWDKLISKYQSTIYQYQTDIKVLYKYRATHLQYMLLHCLMTHDSLAGPEVILSIP